MGQTRVCRLYKFLKATSAVYKSLKPACTAQGKCLCLCTPTQISSSTGQVLQWCLHFQLSKCAGQTCTGPLLYLYKPHNESNHLQRSKLMAAVLAVQVTPKLQELQHK